MASIKQDLTNRSESVERVYGFNVDDRFLVNRRYQRKLVWSIDEKRAFVDSLRQGYPVPLILLADVQHDGQDRFEIIDGMQRLNAIVSFIEGEFDLDGKYFDLQAMAQTKLLLDGGRLIQKTPTVERELCVKIVGYSLPLTVYPAASHEQIDEIFRRINAYGRHLSRQELRVAGVTTAFSLLVRRLAARVRGDVSASDKLYLGAMKQISITSKDLPYGLNVDNIFWVQHNILTREYIRQSRDEELIADMLGYVLLTPKLSSSAEITDELFGYSPTGAKQPRRDEIESAVNKVGVETIVRQYMAVHEVLREIVGASGKRFSELMFADAGQRVPRYFQSVFLGLWEILINDNLVIRDAKRAASALDGAGKNISIGGGGGRFSADDREKNVNVVKGLLKPVCSKRKQEDPALSSWTTEFENILMQSHTEQALYDFKQGFMRLDGSKKLDESLFEKVFKTLSAMANQGPGAVGYVIIGVADDAGTAERLKDLYGVTPVAYQGFLVTGIEHEAADMPKKLDSYFLGITQRLAAAQMSAWAKDQIARNILLINYFGRSLVILRIEAGEEPCDFQGKYYERHGANVSEVPQSRYTALFRRLLPAR
ncbi:MAG: divergent domain protein [Labilithrix sp.]|nr:divergent domain protein [Labilithrix sp.]